MYIGPYVQYLLFVSDFNKGLIFSAYLVKIIKTNFMKTRPLAKGCFMWTQFYGRTDGHNYFNCPLLHVLWTSIKKLKNFTNRLKNFKNQHLPKIRRLTACSFGKTRC